MPVVICSMFPFIHPKLSEAVNNCRHGAYEYGALTADDGEPFSNNALGSNSAEVTCLIVEDAGALACIWSGNEYDELFDHDQKVLDEYEGYPMYRVDSGDKYLIVVTEDPDTLASTLNDTFGARVAVMSDDEREVLEVHRS